MSNLKILVCVKQVPSTTDIMIDEEKGTLLRDGVSAELNPFDTYAIEEAIKIKENHSANITVISMGPAQVESSLREALAMGCDSAILLSDTKFAGADTLATSYTLACAIRKIKDFDLIICGLKTTDGDTGQVGPSLAEELNIPHISYVREIKSIEDKVICVKRFLDDCTEILESKLPALITITKGINEPRYPSMKKRRIAEKIPINLWSADGIDGDQGRFGLNGSQTRVIKVFHPVSRGKKNVISGNPKEQAEQVIKKLKEIKILS